MLEAVRLEQRCTASMYSKKMACGYTPGQTPILAEGELLQTYAWSSNPKRFLTAYQQTYYFRNECRLITTVRWKGMYVVRRNSTVEVKTIRQHIRSYCVVRPASPHQTRMPSAAFL